MRLGLVGTRLRIDCPKCGKANSATMTTEEVDKIDIEQTIVCDAPHCRYKETKLWRLINRIVRKA